MEINEQRKLGVKLAHQVGATKTLEAIKDTNMCYEEIMQTAADEVGFEKLAAVILENDAEWAFHALRTLPGTNGNERASLVEHAGTLFDGAVRLDSAEDAVAAVLQADYMQLHLIAGAAFQCWFTMFWKNTPDGEVFPAAAEPDSGKWKWSIKMSVNNSMWGDYCENFALPNAPLQEGATCWIVVQIQAGGLYELSRYGFTYKSGGSQRYIDAWGALSNPQFGIPSS